MRNFLARASETLVVRYIVVGGTSYVFELSALLIIVYPLHQSRTLGTAISYWIGLGVAFGLQKLIAFRNYERQLKTLTRQSLLYGLLTFWNYFFTIAVVSLFSQDYLIISRTAALLMMSLWNYWLYKKVIFRKVELAV
jgi:putative flippase GtrA